MGDYNINTYKDEHNNFGKHTNQIWFLEWVYG